MQLIVVNKPFPNTAAMPAFIHLCFVHSQFGLVKCSPLALTVLKYIPELLSIWPWLLTLLRLHFVHNHLLTDLVFLWYFLFLIPPLFPFLLSFTKIIHKGRRIYREKATSKEQDHLS